MNDKLKSLLKDLQQKIEFEMDFDGTIVVGESKCRRVIVTKEKKTLFEHSLEKEGRCNLVFNFPSPISLLDLEKLYNGGYLTKFIDGNNTIYQVA